jgi:hypothetical protein
LEKPRWKAQDRLHLFHSRVGSTQYTSSF